MARPSDVAAADETPATAPAADAEVFVRAIDLPTPSLRQARAAVAQQVDILSPLPPGETAWSVVLMGPSEGGLNRFAVGFIPRRALAARAPDGAAVRLTGRLDDQGIEFRFEGAGAPKAPVDRLRLATLAGACLAIVLAGANLRIDRELDQLQSRMDAVAQAEQRGGGEAAGAARALAAWRAVAATRRAGVVDCALGDLAKVGGGPAKLEKLEFADGQVTAVMSAPLSDASVAGFRALGATVAIPPPAAAAPVNAAIAADAASPPTVRQLQVGPAACA